MKKIISCILAISIAVALAISVSAASAEPVEITDDLGYVVFLGGMNHYRKDNEVYYPYKSSFDFYSVRSKYGNVKVRFNLTLEYNADILEFEALLAENALSISEITVIGQGTDKAPSDFENAGYVSFTFEMDSSADLNEDLIFTPKFRVLKEAFINSFGMPRMVQYVTGTMYVLDENSLIPEAVVYSLEGNGASFGEGFTYENLLREFAGYTPPGLKPSSVESVTYEPSLYGENDYIFKVNGTAAKIQFVYNNNSTATFTRDMALIRSYDKNDNEVSQNSESIAYELWTIHRTLRINEEIKVRAKVGSTWENAYKTFTVYLRYQELPFAESVYYNEPIYSPENDYYIKINCIADKVQFINPDGDTATYTKQTAKSVKSFNKNGVKVSQGSRETAYEIWTIHRRMQTDCEMLVKVKAGGLWENTAKAFVVSLTGRGGYSSIESVTWDNITAPKNNYYITINGQPDKISFYNPDNSTATYTRKMAKIESFDENGHIVSADSGKVCYEIWTVNKTMKMNVEMRVTAKFGAVWETEMFKFVVKN